MHSTGFNSSGQLGLGDTANRSSFTQVSGNWTAIAAGGEHSLALSGTKMFSTGSYQQGTGQITDKVSFTEVSGNWDAIATGVYFSFALSAH